MYAGIAGKPSATLLFNRNIKNQFPLIVVEKSPYDKEVRERQNKKYAKVKNILNEKRNAKKRDDIKAGDKVLLKRHKRERKLDSKYLNKKHIVKERKQSFVILVDEEGNEFALNKQFIKKILRPDEFKKHTNKFIFFIFQNMGIPENNIVKY